VLRLFGPRQQLIVPANTSERDLFGRNCKEYFEFLPIALGNVSQWGIPYGGGYKAKKPIYSGAGHATPAPSLPVTRGSADMAGTPYGPDMDNADFLCCSDRQAGSARKLANDAGPRSSLQRGRRTILITGHSRNHRLCLCLLELRFQSGQVGARSRSGFSLSSLLSSAPF
jgi:hypothetical protein